MIALLTVLSLAPSILAMMTSFTHIVVVCRCFARRSEPRDSSPNAVIVFLPQAPTPMSGNIMYLPEERVRPLPITMVEAMSIVKRMGIGSSRALHAIDLALPKSA